MVLKNSRGIGLFTVPPAFYRNMGWQTISAVVSTGFGFLMSVVVGRALGASEFGIMALGLGYAAVVFQLAELRLHEAVIRYVAEFRERKQYDCLIATVKLSLISDVLSGLVAIGLAFALLPWVGPAVIHDPRATTVVVISVLSTFFTNVATATSVGILRVLDCFRIHALITTIAGTIRFVVIVAAVLLLHRGIVTVLIVTAVFSLLTNGVIVAAALSRLRRDLPEVPPRTSLACLRPRISEMRRFVGTTYLLSLASVPTKDLDVNILGLFSTSSVVGTYKIAKNFMAGLWAISDPALFAVYPEIAKMWAKRQFDELHRMVRSLTIVFGALGVAIFALAFVIVPLVIPVLMGADFAGAGTVFRFMSGAFLFWAPFFWVNPILLAAGRPDLMLKTGIITAFITLCLYLVLVPRFAGAGAAVAYALTWPAALFLSLAMARRARIAGVFAA